MNLVSFFDSCGKIGWLLLLAFIWALVLIFERAFYFWESSSRLKKSFVKRFEDKVLEKKRESEKLMKSELQKEISVIYFDMNRGLWLINFIASVSPSLGRLGTVTGLIKAFQGLSFAETQMNIQSLAGGIWEAMLTTAFGMIISIPALFFYRYFRRIIEKRMTRLNLMLEDSLAKEFSDA